MKKLKFPGVKILDRYIIRKFLGTWMFSIAMFVIILVVFDYAEKLEDFINNKAPMMEIWLKYYLNFIPFFINQFVGLLTFIGVVFFTSKMAYNTEIVAMLSSGESFRRLMWPYFLSATAIMLFSLALNLWIIPRANTPRVAFENKYVSSKIRASQMFERHIYRQVAPDTYVYLRSFDGERQTAEFLAIEHYEGRRLVKALEAADARYDEKSGRWRADTYTERVMPGNGSPVNAVPSDPPVDAAPDSLTSSPASVAPDSLDGTASVGTPASAVPGSHDGVLDSVVVATEQFTRHERLDTVINLNTTELGNLDQLIKTMNIHELNDFMAEQRQKGSDSMALLEVERQSRFSYPLAIFILTLIGVSLSSRKVRGGTGLHMGLGIALCFTYILFGRFAEEFAKGGIMPAALAVWMPNILFAAIAVWLYVKAPK